MPITLPSFATIFTGLYPYGHKVFWHSNSLSASFDTLSEYLKNEGYDTAAIVPYIGLYRRGLGQGFDTQWPNNPGIKTGDVLQKKALDWLKGRNSLKSRIYK
jgi:hypothetical protein